MSRITYCQLSNSYWAYLENGKEIWCECPISLEDVLYRLDRRAERKDLIHLIGVVALLVGLVGVVWWSIS